MTENTESVVHVETSAVVIPIEAIVNGEIVVVDTKSIPIIPRKDLDPS